FLYFCDIALFLTVLAMWRESSLMATAGAVGIVLPQLLWMLDFLGSALGLPLTGMTAYMFDAQIDGFARFLSFFHFWLPLLLLWLVWRLGFHRRGLHLWLALAWPAMLISYFFLPAPPAPLSQPALPVNVNYVFGLSDAAPQTWMPAELYFCLLLVVLPVFIWWPTAWILQRCLRASAP